MYSLGTQTFLEFTCSVLALELRLALHFLFNKYEKTKGTQVGDLFGKLPCDDFRVFKSKTSVHFRVI